MQSFIGRNKPPFSNIIPRAIFVHGGDSDDSTALCGEEKHLDVGFARLVVRSTHDRARSFFVARVVQRAPLHAFVTRHASRRRGRARQPRAHASSGCGLVVPPKTRAGRPRSPAMRSKAAQMLRKASALLTKASREVRGDHPPPAARLAPEESSEPREAVPTNPRADWTFPARFWTAPSSSPRRDVPRARRKKLLVY